MTARNVPSFLSPDLDRRQAVRLVVGAAALTLPGAIAACGSSGGGSPAGGSSSQPAVKHSYANIRALTWGIGTGTIIGLDIATAFDGHAMYVERGAREGLLAATNALGLAPLLASSWTYDPANLKYVFQIRSGVKFWDGTTMTIDDVVFSLTRHIDKKVGSQIGAYFANVAAFTKTGPAELTIRLKRPDPDVANSLVFAPILSKAFVAKIGSGLGSPGSGARVMGTGPYQITGVPEQHVLHRGAVRGVLEHQAGRAEVFLHLHPRHADAAARGAERSDRGHVRRARPELVELGEGQLAAHLLSARHGHVLPVFRREQAAVERHPCPQGGGLRSKPGGLHQGVRGRQRYRRHLRGAAAAVGPGAAAGPGGQSLQDAADLPVQRRQGEEGAGPVGLPARLHRQQAAHPQQPAVLRERDGEPVADPQADRHQPASRAGGGESVAGQPVRAQRLDRHRGQRVRARLRRPG